MRIGFFLCLVLRELDLVRVEFKGDPLEVFLDKGFIARGRNTKDLEGVVYC